VLRQCVNFQSQKSDNMTLELSEDQSEDFVVLDPQSAAISYSQGEEREENSNEREVSSFRKRFAEAQFTDSLSEYVPGLVTDSIDCIAERVFVCISVLLL
jgi:hypothetical protein